MIFSEWDEASINHDQQKEKETLNQKPNNEHGNISLLLEIANQLNKCKTTLEEEYGTKAAKLAEIPFNRLIHHILDIYDVTNVDIKANHISIQLSNS
ncbi:hypothetical protein JOD45_002620 [Scopulibacillus daqui]|uniref:Uncharacterized protein n=1 Tax=Scopulibacillus daqui TaxID=1469162 RepID=A0ABS2Q271_9BACL|nr:hypothetical protein [Scopulibacillus daqui]MBM7646392.1 hypothetical protein [Scopulibacillus daqui]